MHYDTLSKNTVKITLTCKDMRENSIRAEGLRTRSADSKRSLIGFLKKFQAESSLFAGRNAERLFLEAFPSEDGGCVLYVSTLGCDVLPPPDTERRQSVLMCSTDTLSDAAELCRCIRRSVRGSALYRLDGRYCLILKVRPAAADTVSRYAEEFGALSDDPVDIASVTEHGTVICETDAVRIMSEKL